MSKDKTRLSDFSISFSTVWKMFVAIGVLVFATFSAMNYYFTPRSVMEKELGCVRQDVSTVKADVKWIRRVWEDGIQKAEVE